MAISDSSPGQKMVSEQAIGVAFRTFARIGLLSFGGPAAQIALMHRVLVDEKGWLTEKQFLNALSFCMLLPGPEAMQLATYAGWRLYGLAGGLMAGLLFVLPGAAVILMLASAYALYGNVSFVGTLFLGIKAAVLIVVVEALLRVARRALVKTEHWVIAGIAFVGIFFLALPFPLIVFLAALFGFLRSSGRQDPPAESKPVDATLGRTAMIVLVWLLIWWLPVAAVDYFSGYPVLTDIGAFFSKLAVVTFGGAYAVLAYMAQDVVNDFGWLSAGEMLDGLGLAETTPGPLILVTEFVGYLAAFRQGGVWLGMAGAAVTLWVTFVPCFLWIFAGAPYIEWISAQPRLAGALSAITAAVVGVILNLSIWFAVHVYFASVETLEIGPVQLLVPDVASLDWRVLVLSAICAVLLLRFHWGITPILLLSSVMGFMLVNAV